MLELNDVVPGLVDLTILKDDARAEEMLALCVKAKKYNVAAVCVPIVFVEMCKANLRDTNIKVATVVNFPSGSAAIEQVATEIAAALSFGADEIDAVLPYQLLLQGDVASVEKYIESYRNACGSTTLKVIVESGLLSAEQIKIACDLCIKYKVEFIKTSTGKVAVGATLAAAQIIVDAIAAHNAQGQTGIKLSGGVRTMEQAGSYLELIAKKFGVQWVEAKHVRFGASSLLP